MRKTMLLSALTLCLITPLALAERLATSGAFVVDLDNPPGDAIRCSTPSVEAGRGNILLNAGFEDGVLAPWTGAGWSISTTSPHAGLYCAYDIGNNGVQQSFTPTPVGQILAITLWERQPEIAISAIDLFYSASDYDEFLVFLSTANWEYFNVTSQLRPSGSLQAIRVWGYMGGGSAPDETFLDDVLIDVQGITPTLDSTWGQIKALF